MSGNGGKTQAQACIWDSTPPHKERSEMNRLRLVNQAKDKGILAAGMTIIRAVIVILTMAEVIQDQAQAAADVIKQKGESKMIELTSVAGVTAATVFLIQGFKLLVVDKIPVSQTWRGVLINAVTVAVGIGLSFAGSFAYTVTPSVGQLLETGLLAGVAAAGGWEVLKNSWQSVVKR